MNALLLLLPLLLSVVVVVLLLPNSAAAIDGVSDILVAELELRLGQGMACGSWISISTAILLHPLLLMVILSLNHHHIIWK